MCEDCGCGVVEINKSIMDENDDVAHTLRHNLAEKGILCINVLGSPGAGKTSFIEGVSKHLKVAVIQGDLESDIDKVRLEKQDIKTYQINTHSGCHLNAQMIKDSLVNFDLSGIDYLFIENVGNLVCPAGVNIGQHKNVVISSTTEGSDKPKKYPIIFYDACMIVISKYDLQKYVNFNEESYLKDLQNINAKAKIVKTGKDSDYKEIAHFFEHEKNHVLGHMHKH